MVNRIAAGISFCILIIAPIVYFLTDSTTILLAVALEFLINNLVLVLNHYKKHKQAGLVLFFLQCTAISYFGAIMGSMLQLHFMVLFLISINYLIFLKKEKIYRNICLVAAIITLAGLQVSYFYTNHLTVSNTAAMIIQSMAISGAMFLVLVIAKPSYVKSNDANKELTRANRFKTMLYSVVSHELRNDLFKIGNLVGYIKREIALGRNIKTIEPMVDHLQQVALNATTVVNTVLNTASEESGREVDNNIEPVDFREYLQKIIALDRMSAQSRNLKIELNIDPSFPTVIYTDLFRFREIFTNLTSNALKYSYKHTVIQVEVRTGIRNYTIRVSNTGDTIPADIQRNIFNPFITNKSARIEGTGLGLFICANSVRMLQGSIQVSSASNLTTFTLTLPLQEGTTADLRDNTTESGMAPMPYHILVADDDEFSRKVMEKNLAIAGCRVSGAENGIEVIEKAQKESPDVIVLDYYMPRLNGIETCRLLKQHPDTRHIPVVIASGMDAGSMENELTEAGVDGVLTKPYTMKDLRALLHKVIPAPVEHIR
ncbi:hybrid sensor histidine kinase/response regulator [Chitinophaga solisilvae]|uniref:histidine kinase n=1 Tax=Chitinophaga solisilvae TaxID=1233460 RepID=A0A9Q5DB40_9BACT|nr:hybrid sensor histidine kinase/response regulator [Chitinophaga solisilvae]NSL87282.1 hybrid sensor histidine kinase/response regulator [Chitinophaga solisilvae]